MSGKSSFALAVAHHRLGEDRAALDQAWQASLDHGTAVAARAFVAKLLARQGDLEGVVKALSAPGPWQTDPVCRNRLAESLLMRGQPKASAALARQNLDVDPLDAFALSILWFGGSKSHGSALDRWIKSQPFAGLDLAADYLALGHEHSAWRITETWLRARRGEPSSPLGHLWAGYLQHQLGQPTQADQQLRLAREPSPVAVPDPALSWPYRYEFLPALRWAQSRSPDGHASLALGHLLFHLNRHNEARDYWRHAADRGATPAIACRALGMASLVIDQSPDSATQFLTRAHEAEPADAIIARDLARVLFTLADQSPSSDRKRELILRARDILRTAFNAGKGRSDFIALLARAHNRLGDYAETARLLDSVRITIWEGAREAHDLFEEAHLTLGEAHLEATRYTEALAEFNRALEYPRNLATGRLENAREAHIHYLRGRALAALGQSTAAREAYQKAADEPPSKDTRKESARQKARETLKAFH
jgi:tetratricopeptide (TPR) repeat protein